KRLGLARQDPAKHRRSLGMMLPIELDPTAAVWRTWYTTLAQLLATMDPEEAAQIVVRPLPGDITVAGEWFLGIPAYSAAPDVGLAQAALYAI
ncbi:hypothetical protein ACTWKD_14440, partial [Halanaerobium saccharolyticum]|uniref:hypothetical protein n=1 Tax=Halanaerobium saccharolyticum TaxID=43595 RepID=UPI003FCD1712